MSRIRTLWQVSVTYWNSSSPAQRVLFMAGSILFAWMVLHGALLVLTDSALHGPVSYRKAATFAETGWLMCWSIGYVLPYLRLNRWQHGFIVGSTLLFGLGETFLMSWQVWRGEPSHYNFTDAFSTMLFGTTGIIAGVWLLSMVVLLWRTLRPNELAPSMALAYQVGTVMMIFGGVTGFWMILNLSGTYQGAFLQNAQTLINGDMLGSFTGQPTGSGGNIVVLHALGVHGLEVMPLAAWLLSYTNQPEHRRTRVTAAVVVSYIAVTVLLSLQTLQTAPLTALNPLLGGLLAAGALVLGGAYAWILRRLAKA